MRTLKEQREVIATRSYVITDHDHRTTETLIGAEVIAVLDAMPDKAAMLRAASTAFMSDRKMDRAVQILRKAGLARYTRDPGPDQNQWVRVTDTSLVTPVP